VFRIGPLPPGYYDLICAPEGRGSLKQDGIVLAAGQTLDLPPFRFDSQSPLHLELRHADGRPVTGAIARLEDRELGYLSCTATDTEPGRYRTPPGMPGAYTLKVRGPTFAPLTRRVDVGADPSRPACVIVPDGVPVELRFHPVMPQTRWVAAMQVRLRDAAGEDVIRELIQVDGRSSFAWRIGLRPGHYTLEAEVMYGGRASVEFDVQARASEQDEIDVRLLRR
jgi:hypothetical protein